MKYPFSLVGKIILITGASSGIGRAIAIACSNMGATLYITGRNKKKLEETLSLMDGDNHHIVIADLTNKSDRQLLFNSLPNIDCIVNNAGIGSRVLCKNITEDDIDKVMSANFKSSVLFQSLLLNQKKINRGGSIVFIASMAAISPSIGNAIYSSSKGAIISYAKCLSLEVASRKIRVNCICPAMVWTDLIMLDGASKEIMEDAQKKYPLKRYGKPEDIANLTIYLLSDASSWMTGSCIDITGGAIEL
jgi:NAD(P)-dependent dehydrogenase (short-subunit alcohol dehydrogenase family)